MRNQLNAFEADSKAFQAETRAKFKAVQEKIDAEAKRNDTRFNVLTGLMIANFAAVFVLVLQNLFGG